MTLMQWFCKTCNMITPYLEDKVTDVESATVWHCMYCGSERRPNEPGSPNEPAKPKSPLPVGSKGNEK